MIGAVRSLARYAAPRSGMNAVGEWVSRPVPRPTSTPRGASAPPITSTDGSAALTASYVRASSDS